MSTIDGNLDNIVGNFVEGWTFKRDMPDFTVCVSLFVDGQFVTNALANQYREDLEKAGIGKGDHAFRIPLSDSFFDGKEHTIDVRVGEWSLHKSPMTLVTSKADAKTTRIEPVLKSVPSQAKASAVSKSAAATENNPLSQAPAKAATKTIAKAVGKLEGSFEPVEGEWIKAWAWDIDAPDRHVSVIMRIDGEEVAVATADQFRNDLKRNNKGDGCHGLRMAIPERYLDGAEHTIEMLFADTGKPLKNSPRTAQLQSKPQYAGSLDAADYPEIRGWAWNAAKPDETVKVDLYINGKKTLTVAADELRGDLEKAGIGNGYKAFKKRLTQSFDPSRSYTISARYAGTDIELKKSPITLKFPATDNKFRMGIERHPGDVRPTTSPIATAKDLDTKAASLPPQLLPAGKTVRPDISLAAAHIEALDALQPPTVIVPIYNAYDEVVECLEALISNTTCPAELLLINDCSTDERMASLLKKYEKYSRVTVLTNEKNLGFTRTVNRGMSHASHDIILLNSDTKVTPRWLENMIFAAYRDPRIATVTAISDNIGAFSVPHSGNNEMPEWLDRDQTGRLIAAVGSHIYADAPTGNGFCMYVKRKALDQVGLFDYESFPRGYGEENDFCMRALKQGWRHVVDDSTFVFHKRSASFGEEKQTLIVKSGETLRAKHPEYKALVSDFTQSAAMLKMRQNIKKALDSLQQAHDAKQPISPNGLPRLLYVLHGGATGGTPQTNADLMQTMQGKYDTFVLDCDFENIVLKRYIDGVFYEIERWTLLRRLSPLEINRDDYNAVLFEVLKAYAFELVHIRHLYKHMLSLPKIAHTLNIPVVFSFHDFYYVCPTINLLDEKAKYCAGTCTKTVPDEGEDCPNPFAPGVLPPLKHQWVHTWRDKVRAFLPYVDAFVTTCDDAKSVYVKTYPELKKKTFKVIEHGRDFERQDHLAQTPEPGGKLRILIPGQLTQHKGADFIAELIALDEKKGKRLEFHFLGNLPARYQHLGVWHGAYQRHEFQDRVAEIGCHIMGIFSIWAETYCHTLSESWACGIPVVTSHYGALGDRITKHGGGWLVDIEKPKDAYKIICGIADNPKDFQLKVAQSSLSNLRTTQQMGSDYAKLYGEILLKRQTFLNVEKQKNLSRK
jgi:GT2 family glycosyltransferase/glycosyltransferase involved in cell wall biosynthesis